MRAVRDALAGHPEIDAQRIERSAVAGEEPIGADSDPDRRAEMQWFTGE